MLKKLSPKHEDIIRRLVLGASPGEICMTCNIAPVTLSILKTDPLFQTRLQNMMDEIDNAFISARVSAMEELEDVAPDAAKLCSETVKNEAVPLHMRLRSAWDILDRTGTTKQKQKPNTENTVNVAQLIIQAYNKKHEDKCVDVNANALEVNSE